VNATVIGAGSWGTALAVVLDSNGHDVRIWAREQEIADAINLNHHNPTYLPELALPPSITAYTDLADCARNRDLIVFATPSHTMREVSLRVKPYLEGDEIVVSVSKGIENGTYLTMTQVLAETLAGTIIEDHIGALYGPSHAEEVSRLKPTALVSAAYGKSATLAIQQAFMTPMFRVYANHDLVGVEVGGSVKNIMAIAAGIVDGAGLGDNAKAALLTRGLQEMKRLGMRMGGSSDTFSGLAGIGDLIVTCTSEHSRNRYVGYHIGKGEKLGEIVARMSMVAEGVNTTRSVHGLALKLGVDMPITHRVHEILFDGKCAMEAMRELMTREAKDEMFST
jgi:glycerol-3-phosphate dehydrogenase (NAD(P)+)